MTLPCWTAIFISRFHILWLHILCVFLASHKTEIMSVISAVAPLRGRPPSILSNPISLFSGCLFLSSGLPRQSPCFDFWTHALRRASPSVRKTNVSYSPTHGINLLWFQKENLSKSCLPGPLLIPAQCPRSLSH